MGWVYALIIGAIGGAIYKIWEIVYGWIKKQFTVEIQVRNYEVRGFLTEWLALHINTNKYKVLEAEVDTLASDIEDSDYTGNSWMVVRALKRKAKKAGRVIFTLGRGRHLVWFEGKPVFINIKLEGDGESASEAINLTSFGRDNVTLRRLVVEAERQYNERRSFDLSVYSFDGKSGSWYRSSLQSPRPIGSVILKGDTAGKIISDVERFLDDAERYRKLDIPYRRGYLFYGPPGTGKSSLAKAVATEFNMDLYVLSLSGLGVSDEGVHRAISTVARGCLLLIEDIDCARVATRDKESGQESLFVSMSGLLNSIDGVAAGEDRVLVMTTNYIEKLDPALIRPGRVDVKYELGLTDEKMAERMFDRFFPGSKYAKPFAKKATGVSPASIQSHMMLEWGSDKEACDGYVKK